MTLLPSPPHRGPDSRLLRVLVVLAVLVWASSSLSSSWSCRVGSCCASSFLLVPTVAEGRGRRRRLPTTTTIAATRKTRTTKPITAQPPHQSHQEQDHAGCSRANFFRESTQKILMGLGTGSVVWKCGTMEPARAEDSTLSSGPVVVNTDLTAGAQLFTQNCAACHRQGGNLIARTKTLEHAALDRYLDGGATPDAVAQIISHGKQAMPSFAARFDAAQLDQVAAYVLSQADIGWTTK